ncbi:MAG: EAL domain-containing protein, partial [Halothiobacillus sp.]
MNTRIQLDLDGQHVAIFDKYSVRSAFQPIISVAHQRIVGYEGLARVQDKAGQAIAPFQLFDSAQDIESLVTIDRVCRELHLQNFARANLRPRWILINVHPL